MHRMPDEASEYEELAPRMSPAGRLQDRGGTSALFVELVVTAAGRCPTAKSPIICEIRIR